MSALQNQFNIIFISFAIRIGFYNILGMNGKVFQEQIKNSISTCLFPCEMNNRLAHIPSIRFYEILSKFCMQRPFWKINSYKKIKFNCSNQ